MGVILESKAERNGYRYLKYIITITVYQAITVNPWNKVTEL